MKVSYIKSKNDLESFKIPKILGINVVELENVEKVDENINELVNKKYNTIVLSNEVAGFSESIIKKYYNSKDINIIIAPSKRI